MYSLIHSVLISIFTFHTYCCNKYLFVIVKMQELQLHVKDMSSFRLQFHSSTLMLHS